MRNRKADNGAISPTHSDFVVRSGTPNVKQEAPLLSTKEIIKFIAVSIVLAMSISFIVTDSFLFGYQLPSLTLLKKMWSPSTRTLSLEELAKYDGENGQPVYISINGHVFDVTAGRGHYKKGSGYGVFVGRDASRAFITGCFQTHLTHDLRGLTQDQIKQLNGWVDFYMNHQEYEYIGRVALPPIDPASPIPEDCDRNGGKKGGQKPID
eukprot:Partr_v1_DN23734_c0_g1_i1_m52960 putative cytochrome b5 domain containing 2